jgi:hypothetical protein
MRSYRLRSIVGGMYRLSFYVTARPFVRKNEVHESPPHGRGLSAGVFVHKLLDGRLVGVDFERAVPISEGFAGGVNIGRAACL